jgi:hypothetical protein
MIKSAQELEEMRSEDVFRYFRTQSSSVSAGLIDDEVYVFFSGHVPEGFPNGDRDSTAQLWTRNYRFRMTRGRFNFARTPFAVVREAALEGEGEYVYKKVGSPNYEVSDRWRGILTRPKIRWT